MSISPALVTGARDYPESGSIGFLHSDGSSLSINADTGDAATFNFTINDGAAITSGVGNWAESDVDELPI